MWADNAASEDFLNFGVLAKVIAETIEKNGDRPLSIGISGAWGVGKSTTLELLATELQKHDPKPIVVRFHPWRHQTQDNVRAAFAECIAKTLIENCPTEQKVVEKARSILKRANLIRIAGYGLGGALTLATGIPFGGFISKGADAISGVLDGDVTSEDAGKVANLATESQKKFAELFPEEEAADSPYENIEKICSDFEEALSKMNRRLIVLIDDLDRCLPNTTIEALEAMRLYFFVRRTVFVVAADEEMLRLAVRKHFEVSDQTLDESHLQSYYDKLIQLPFRLPSLTIPDAIVYMTLLLMEQEKLLSEVDRESVRAELCTKLGQTWTGTRITRDTVTKSLEGKSVSPGFENRIALIERLAPVMVVSKKIGGNPRLIKRFMNSLMVREALAKAINAPGNTTLDVLAKILLLQRCGDRELVNSLQSDVLSSPDGKSILLARMESEQSQGGMEILYEEIQPKKLKAKDKDKTDSVPLPRAWTSDFAIEWLALDPKLADVDLRPAFHVSRGADAAFSQTVKLSEDTRELLETLLKNPQAANQFEAKITAISADEIPSAMGVLVNRLQSCDNDDFNEMLRCCVVVEKKHESQSSLLKSALVSLDESRWSPAATLILSERPWASDILSHLKQLLPAKHPAIRALENELTKGRT